MLLVNFHLSWLVQCCGMESGLKPTLESQILQSNAIFANDLYQIMAKKEGNLIFSPISVHLVLSMLYQGSHGDTSYTLAHTLKNRSAKSTAEGYKSVMERLSTLPNHIFSFNHKIYVPKHQMEVRNEFANTLTKHFLTEVELINFGKPRASAAAINRWATTKTKGKISHILDKKKLKQNFGIIGISAIFFDGEWVTQFSKKSTKTLNFFVNKEKSIRTKIMYQKSRLLYKHDDQLQAQIVEIPYKNYNIKMLVILPFESSSVGDLEEKMATTNLEALRKNLQMKEVNLYLPKFKMESTLTFSDILCEVIKSY